MSCLIFVDVPVVTVGKRDGSERRTAIAGIITLPQSIPELASEVFPIVATWNSGREAAEHVIHRDLQAGDFYRRVGERPAPFERILQRGGHPMMYPDWYSVCDEALDGVSAKGAAKAMREIEAGAEPLIAIDISEAVDSVVLRQIEEHRQHLERFVVVGDHLYVRIAEPYLALMQWSNAYQFVPIDEPDDLIEVPAAIFPLPNYDEAAAWLSRYCRPGPEATVEPYDCRRPDLFSKTLRSGNLALFVRRAERAVVEYMRMLPPWRYASFIASLTSDDQILWRQMYRRKSTLPPLAASDNERLVRDLLSLGQESGLRPALQNERLSLLRSLLSERFGLSAA